MPLKNKQRVELPGGPGGIECYVKVIVKPRLKSTSEFIDLRMKRIVAGDGIWILDIGNKPKPILKIQYLATWKKLVQNQR
ncbi:MAG: hypothetical protein GWP06_02180 [Actinobacteria bacterium]|nr:hypothetical protein [Actinomycetota bacterium]